MKKAKEKLKKRNQPRLNLAVAWYKPEQWPRLLEISADADELEKTHAQWLANAEKALKGYAAHEVALQKVEVDTEKLLAWCNERGEPVNGESRSHYAAWLLQEMDGRTAGESSVKDTE